MVSLWDLMTLMCVALPVGGALGSARAAKAGFGGQVLAVAVGLAIGLSFAGAMRKAGVWSVARIRELPYASKERYFRLLYLAGFLWLALGLGLSAIVSAALIRGF